MDQNAKTTGLSRRTFLATSSAAVAGVALGGLISQSEAAKRDSSKGGTLSFATRLDATGLDSHRANQYHPCWLSPPFPSSAWAPHRPPRIGGSDLNLARDHMESQPLIAVFPGLAISFAVLGFNLFGDGLRDILDPRLVEQ